MVVVKYSIIDLYIKISVDKKINLNIFKDFNYMMKMMKNKK